MDLQYENALDEFKAKIETATGRAVLDREVQEFYAQVETALAHRQARLVQIGLCDFQTLDGSSTLIEVKF